MPYNEIREALRILNTLVRDPSVERGVKIALLEVKDLLLTAQENLVYMRSRGIEALQALEGLVTHLQPRPVDRKVGGGYAKLEVVWKDGKPYARVKQVT